MSTEADIVERLRWPGIAGPDDHPLSAALRAEAADLITKLRAERDAAARDMRERLAKSFEDSVHNVWDAGEIADHIRAYLLIATDGKDAT